MIVTFVSGLLSIIVGDECFFRLDPKPTTKELDEYNAFARGELYSKTTLSPTAGYGYVAEELTERGMDMFVIPMQQFLREWDVSVRRPGQTPVSDFTQLVDGLIKSAKHDPVTAICFLKWRDRYYGVMVASGRIGIVYRI
ncbi:MAG: hypothetical protein AAB776_03650 [Patescibacteria group bacterium]